MTLKLKSANAPSPAAPFSWDNLPTTPDSSPSPPGIPPSPPTAWLSAKDMKIFGSEPLRFEIGLVRCNLCEKPILRSAILEHAENCRLIRAGGLKKGVKGKDSEAGKKRSADDAELGEEGGKKKKPATKITKGRFKGPVDPDKQCCVINDKNLPCSRSLTCKSHSMGAKRAVPGRSKPYDELLLEWNRLNNPNFVEPVKKVSKAEKKEIKEREKAEKKRLAGEAAAAAQANKTPGGSTTTKKGKKATTSSGTGAAGSGTAGAAGNTQGANEEEEEDIDDLDSEAELDSMVKAVRNAQTKRLIGVPLAVPRDAGTWFVARRERLRNCRDLLAGALASRPGVAVGVPGATRLSASS